LEYHKWNKDPLKHSCDSYLNARKEIGILLSLHHEHIVSLVALCVDPLALVLHLAPQGSLSDRLKDYSRAGDRLKTPVIRDVIVQVSVCISVLYTSIIALYMPVFFLTFFGMEPFRVG